MPTAKKMTVYCIYFYRDGVHLERKLGDTPTYIVQIADSRKAARAYLESHYGKIIGENDHPNGLIVAVDLPGWPEGATYIISEWPVYSLAEERPENDDPTKN